MSVCLTYISKNDLVMKVASFVFFFFFRNMFTVYETQKIKNFTIFVFLLHITCLITSFKVYFPQLPFSETPLRLIAIMALLISSSEVLVESTLTTSKSTGTQQNLIVNTGKESTYE